MLGFIFGGIYTYDAETLAPLFIRLAVFIAVLAVVYDFFKRRSARKIINALNNAGADSAENAKTVDELEKLCPGVSRSCRVMLKDYSMLRRLVMKVDDGSTEEKKSTHLTGNERFYIPAAPKTEEEGIEALKSNSRRIPSSLREGGEKSAFKMIVGLVLLVIAAEILIYFFPGIYGYIFENSKNIFG